MGVARENGKPPKGSVDEVRISKKETILVTVLCPKTELSIVARARRSSPTRTDGSMRLNIGTLAKLSNPFDYPAKLGASGNLLVTLLEAHDPRLEHNLGKR